MVNSNAEMIVCAHKLPAQYFFNLILRIHFLSHVGLMIKVCFFCYNRSMNYRFLPVKPIIKLADLEKIDVRVGTIEKVEDVEKSDKLVRLIVDFGEFKRAILVGMKKERADVKGEIEGKQALFVVNLEFKKMMGEESQGMVFDIGYANGIVPVLAMPEKPVPNGNCAG